VFTRIVHLLRHDRGNFDVRWRKHDRGSLFFRVSYSNGSCNENKHHAYFTDAQSFEEHSGTTLSAEIKDKWRTKCEQLIVDEKVEQEVAATAVDYAFLPVPWS
jgi:hypothetical protein